MSRTQHIYAEHGLFIGPSPATGQHWLSSTGILGDTTGDWNLIAPMNRVQTVAYSINTPKTEVKQLGKWGTIIQPMVNHPTVNLDVSYLQNGVFNEVMLGFTANYTEIDGATINEPHYHNNYGVFVLSGFTCRLNTRVDNTIDWPFLWNDNRNIFVGVETEGNDLNYNTEINAYPIHPRAGQIGVVGFGNCYINKYSSQASVGNFPIANVSFVCENMTVYASGNQCRLPALSPESGLPISSRRFTLPFNYVGDALVSVIKPGDITIDITQLPRRTEVLAIQGTGISGGLYARTLDLGLDISDVKIQSYSINLPINRRPMEALGYRLPIDREVWYPIYANVGFDMIAGDYLTGSLSGMVNKDDEYNFAIKLRNPLNNKYQGTAVRYDVKRAKLENINYQNQIGGNQTVHLEFAVEVDPQDFNEKGFFISGLLNVDPENTVFGLM